jgi:hypothetical protein
MSGDFFERAGAAQAQAFGTCDQTAIRRIGLVVNNGKREALKAADIVRAWARERGVACTDDPIPPDMAHLRHRDEEKRTAAYTHRRRPHITAPCRPRLTREDCAVIGAPASSAFIHAASLTHVVHRSQGPTVCVYWSLGCGGSAGPPASRSLLEAVS